MSVRVTFSEAEAEVAALSCEAEAEVRDPADFEAKTLRSAATKLRAALEPQSPRVPALIPGQMEMTHD